MENSSFGLKGPDGYVVLLTGGISLHTHIFKELVAVLAMTSVLLDFLSDTTLEIPASVLQPFHFYVLFVRKLKLLTPLGFITKRQCYSERKCI